MRFSLRGLLIAVAVIAVTLSVLIFATRSLRERMAIRSHLESIGAYAVAFGPDNSISAAFHDPIESESISKYRKIAVLDFKEARVTPESLAHLAALEQVQTIIFCLSDVRDEDVPALQEIGSVHNLILAHTQLTDASIDAITKIEGLRIVDVRNTNITAAGIERLRAARPNLTVRER